MSLLQGFLNRILPSRDVADDTAKPSEEVVDDAVEEPEVALRDYYYPGGSGCLINRFSETNSLNLEWLENKACSSAYAVHMARMLESDGRTHDPDEFLSPAGLSAMHRELFGRVYDWAGELRLCPIDIRGQKHCKMSEVPKKMEYLANLIDDCRASANGKSEVSSALSRLCVELNEIHPFPNGNGRTQMLFCTEFANAVGYDLFLMADDIAVFDKARVEMHGGDDSALKALFEHRLFDKNDSSDLHKALIQGVFDEAKKAFSDADIERMGRNIPVSMFTYDSDYISSRGSGRRLPSMFEQIESAEKAKAGKDTGPDV